VCQTFFGKAGAFFEMDGTRIATHEMANSRFSRAGYIMAAVEKFSVKSQAFQEGQTIPHRYTGEGEDVSPPLQWSRVPAGTREFAILCEDPDAPTPEPWVHWLAYNISPSTTMLPEGLPPKAKIDVPVRLEQGRNSFGKLGYNGPMPPVGHGLHRYIFTVYALDTELAIVPGTEKKNFVNAIRNHVLGEGRITGTYERKRVHGGQPSPGGHAA
jgi:Raf kinase inhibitor-like YbhB/YbcL family protein